MASKICPKCNEKCAPRLRKCKKCDSVFAFKVKKKTSFKKKAIPMSDWKELTSGDYIRVSGGPVWIDKDKNEMSMGYDGLYVVMKLDKNGIIAQGKDKNSGFCHIWMEDEQFNSFGILKRPHRVFKINLNTN